MLLTHVQVTNFRSINDTGEFSIKDVTCLVGKNESGKTTVLQALERLNPYDVSKKRYDKLRDYPRRHWADYSERHPDGEARVLRTRWQLDDADFAAVAAIVGPGSIQQQTVEVSKSYETDTTNWDVSIDSVKVLTFLVEISGCNANEAEEITGFGSITEVQAHLTALSERSTGQQGVLARIAAFRNGDPVLSVIDVLAARMPKFLYFSRYSRMSGAVAVDGLAQSVVQGKLSEGDNVFMAFLDYAGTTLDDLKNAQKFEDMRARVEAASNKITERIFQYWSQNQHLSIEVTIDAAKSGDEAPFNVGTILRARVRNQLHRVTVPFDDRSAGFVWFFSFLVLFARVQKAHGNVIILLDEPGHGLHGKAQADLLRYVDEQLRPSHQVVYSTHSPFMVPAERLDTVRLVEDVLQPTGPYTPPKVLGTKVTEDFLSTDADTLFPLQAALGYEVSQTLFVGKHTLLVEGPSDILYLQAASAALKARNKPGLDPRWTLCPSGGVDKVWPFVSMFAGKHLHVAVLTDFAHGMKKNLDRLKNSPLLKDGHLLTAADFVDGPEADIEDLIDRTLWCRIVSAAYELDPSRQLDPSKLEQAASGTPRAVIQTEAYFRTLPDVAMFDHFTPSNWLIQHPEALSEGAEVNTTLDRFSNLFSRLAGLLP